jgi:lysophospholipase L1-like esterase
MLFEKFTKPVCVVISLLLLHTAFSQSAETKKWEKEISEFEKADKMNAPGRKPIVFTGSSSIRMWKSLDKDFPGKRVVNRGFGGSQTDAVVFYADRVIVPYKPKQVVIYIGDNDLASGKSVDKVFSDLKELFEHIRKEVPKATITFISIKPSPSRWKLIDSIKAVNGLVSNYLSTIKRGQYVDVFNPMLEGTGRPKPEHFLSDSLHMTPAGYAVWTRVLKPYLR